MNDFILVCALGILVPTVLTILALEGRKGRYRIDVGRQLPSTLPTVKCPCTCGRCCDCDPLAMAFPGVEAPVGYGLTGLPLDMEDADTVGFPLPAWATSEICGNCHRRSEELGFLCQRCTLVAGREDVHRIYQLLEDGDYAHAWRLAEALIRDLKEFGSKAACN